MVLSFGSFRFSNQHLECNIHPKYLHRDFHFRRLNYGNHTHVNVTINVTDDNKAVTNVALDRSDRSYYNNETMLSGDMQQLQTSSMAAKLPIARNVSMLVELKNCETYNGHLFSCDSWMNINLRDVMCTSKDGFWRMPECYIRGNTIKYLRILDEVIDMVKEEAQAKSRSRAEMSKSGRCISTDKKSLFGIWVALIYSLRKVRLATSLTDDNIFFACSLDKPYLIWDDREIRPALAN
uniref:U6 snRNA-associated Sm-like protein LSm4 n=1 Tax=Glossina austeni TaxID=7395 RepID=A0A1A9UWW0_GLOAU